MSLSICKLCLYTHVLTLASRLFQFYTFLCLNLLLLSPFSGRLLLVPRQMPMSRCYKLRCIAAFQHRSASFWRQKSYEIIIDGFITIKMFDCLATNELRSSNS